MSHVLSYAFDKCIMSCVYHYSVIQNSFTRLPPPPAKKKISCASLTYPSPDSPKFWQPLIFFSTLIILLFSECHRVGIMQYISFLDWLLSHSSTCLRFLMSLHGLMAPFFLFLNNVLLCGCATIYSFTY